MLRRILSLVSALSLILTLAAPVRAAKKSEISPYAQRLLQYYRHYQEDAEDVIWDILRQMEAVDAGQAAIWENIMEDWSWVNSQMPVCKEVLPDGLPEDDSLCIVVLGYALAEDGTMREELVDRLVVALASALKYPNAWIAVTGGQTSEVKGATEAGQMSAWLQKKGVDKSRILVDNQALSTTANAENVYKLLNKSYPQVDSVAVITSDYHISWGSAMFAAVSNYSFGYEAGNPIDVVAGAVCDTGKTWDTMALQAAGISTITGVFYDGNASAPALYPVDRPTEPEIQPTEATEAAQERVWFWEQSPEREPEPAEEAAQEQTETGKNYTLPILLAVLLTVVYIFTPKKPRKKRKKPEWKWEE